MPINKELLIKISHCLRKGESHEANVLLSSLCEQLMQHLSQMEASQEKDSIIQIVPVMLEAQSNRDYLYLADILEFELIKNFN